MTGSKATVEDALSNLASRLKLDSLTLNESNETYLLFDQKFHVTCTFDEAKDEFILSTMIGEVERGSVEAYKKILGDNFFWAGTAGSRLYLAPTGDDKPDMLTLKEIVPMAMFDAERLYERMEDFVNAVEYWTGEYPKLPQGGSSSFSSSSEGAVGAMPMMSA